MQAITHGNPSDNPGNLRQVVGGAVTPGDAGVKAPDGGGQGRDIARGQGLGEAARRSVRNQYGGLILIAPPRS